MIKSFHGLRIFDKRITVLDLIARVNTSKAVCQGQVENNVLNCSLLSILMATTTTKLNENIDKIKIKFRPAYSVSYITFS